MTLSDKTNQITSDYRRRQIPSLSRDDLGPYLQEELRAIEASIRSLVDASIQVADRAPLNPRKGMVRYAVSPWEPLGSGVEGLVVYNGTQWIAV